MFFGCKSPSYVPSFPLFFFFRLMNDPSQFPSVVRPFPLLSFIYEHLTSVFILCKSLESNVLWSTVHVIITLSHFTLTFLHFHSSAPDFDFTEEFIIDLSFIFYYLISWVTASCVKSSVPQHIFFYSPQPSLFAWRCRNFSQLFVPVFELLLLYSSAL